MHTPEITAARGFPDPSKGHVHLAHDFVLPTLEEARLAKEGVKERMKAQ